MTVTEELIEIGDAFAAKDRRRAMEELMSVLYYKVAPRVTGGDTFTLFAHDGVTEKFREKHDLDGRALHWLLNAMCEEEVLKHSGEAYMLTPLGVEKLCLTFSNR